MASKAATRNPIASAQIHARRVAANAARAAQITVSAIGGLEDLTEVARLFDLVWSGGSYMPANFLRALAHSSNYVGAAYAEGRMVGALVGFRGMYQERPALHSHMLAVLPELRSRRIGYALKLHQRQWALEREIETVTWTFDPLVSRNAYLNLTKLGAEGREYLTNFYGRMEDSINYGDESDRLFVVWPLASRHAIAVTEGKLMIAPAGSRTATVLAPGPDGEPLMTAASADVLICRIPADIAKLRRDDVELARAWRLALRRMLGGALEAGYRATGFTRAGSYTLTRR